jgi:hypothetical protein
MKLSELYELWICLRAFNKILSVVRPVISESGGLNEDIQHLEEVLNKLYKVIKEIEKQKTDFVYIIIERNLEWNEKKFKFEKTLNYLAEK